MMIKTWKQRIQELPGLDEAHLPSSTWMKITVAAMDEEIKELRAALYAPSGGTFEDFWQVYPRKVGKEAARRSWAKIKNKPLVLEQIKAALSWQTKSEQWAKPQFVPHPATYLNQGRWQDEPPIQIDQDLISRALARAK